MGEALKYKAEKSKDFLLEIGDGGQSLPTLPSTSLPSAPKPPPPLPGRKAATVACSGKRFKMTGGQCVYESRDEPERQMGARESKIWWIFCIWPAS